MNRTKKKKEELKMKKIMTIMAALLLTASVSQAQIFLMDEEEYGLRDGSLPEDISLIVPTHWVTYDQYAPIGGGTLLLAGLGGAYLLGKKRKK